MKKFFSIILALLCLCVSARGESAAFESYASAFAIWSDAAWAADESEQLQAIKVSDQVQVCLCLGESEIAAMTVEFSIPDETVRAALSSLGWLSEAAIAQILDMEEDSAQTIEDCMVYRIHGEKRDCFALCRADDADSMLWQPVHGGTKLHTDPYCSNMDVPRMISDFVAAQIGWEDCKRCH